MVIDGTALLAACLLYPVMGVLGLPLAMLLAYSCFYTPYAIFLSQRHYRYNLLRFEQKAIVLPAAALASLLNPKGWAAGAMDSAVPMGCHFAPKARRVIWTGFVALLFMAWTLAAIAWWAFWQWVHNRHVGAPQRLAEQVRGMLGGAFGKRLPLEGEAGVAELSRAINDLADQREALRGDVAAQIEQASQGVQQEKNRLAALMAELTQSVVVCNLDGRVLLYNNRARTQFRAMDVIPRWRAALHAPRLSRRHAPEMELCRLTLESERPALSLRPLRKLRGGRNAAVCGRRCPPREHTPKTFKHGSPPCGSWMASATVLADAAFAWETLSPGACCCQRHGNRPREPPLRKACPAQSGRFHRAGRRRAATPPPHHPLRNTPRCQSC
mgnify:CR=1 FL=1